MRFWSLFFSITFATSKVLASDGAAGSATSPAQNTEPPDWLTASIIQEVSATLGAGDRIDTHSCGYCGNKSAAARCQSCHLQVFCSAECQKKAWKKQDEKKQKPCQRQCAYGTAQNGLWKLIAPQFRIDNRDEFLEWLLSEKTANLMNQHLVTKSVQKYEDDKQGFRKHYADAAYGCRQVLVPTQGIFRFSENLPILLSQPEDGKAQYFEKAETALRKALGRLLQSVRSNRSETVETNELYLQFLSFCREELNACNLDFCTSYRHDPATDSYVVSEDELIRLSDEEFMAQHSFVRSHIVGYPPYKRKSVEFLADQRNEVKYGKPSPLPLHEDYTKVIQKEYLEFLELARKRFSSTTEDSLVKDCAWFHCEALAIHPFSAANKRLIRTQLNSFILHFTQGKKFFQVGENLVEYSDAVFHAMLKDQPEILGIYIQKHLVEPSRS